MTRARGNDRVGAAPSLRELVGHRVVLVPVTGEHLADLRATPEVRARWGDAAEPPGWPFDDSSSVRYAVVDDRRVVGMVRRYERDGDGHDWHDGLLVDLLVVELVDPVRREPVS